VTCKEDEAEDVGAVRVLAANLPAVVKVEHVEHVGHVRHVYHVLNVGHALNVE
jgi:hypothetical protein